MCVCVRGDIQFFSLNLVTNLWEILQELIQVFQTAVAAAADKREKKMNGDGTEEIFFPPSSNNKAMISS